MSDWRIAIPFRDVGEPLYESGFLANKLPPEEREVTQNIVIALNTEHGCRTVGDALTALENASPITRRELLNRARQEAGLKPTEEIDADERFAAARRAALSSPPRRPIAGFDDPAGIKRCSAPDCGRFPLDEHGALRTVVDRRWWCEQHRDLAEPGDELPDEDRTMMLSPTFQLIPSPREQRQMQAKQERERAKRDAEKWQRVREVEALQRVRERHAEQPVEIAGIRFRPIDGVIVDG